MTTSARPAAPIGLDDLTVSDALVIAVLHEHGHTAAKIARLLDVQLDAVAEVIDDRDRVFEVFEDIVSRAERRRRLIH